METVDNTRHLDPPDDTPELSRCDGCGGTFLTQDLTKTGKHYPHAWLCPACIEDGTPADGEQ